MKDAINLNAQFRLSPRIIAVHGLTGNGKSTVFPLAITHWTEHAEGLTPGLTVCAQPRRILAQQLCERVRSNRKMRYNDRAVGYMIARESSRDTSTKLLYCTEAILALMMQARLMSTAPRLPQDVNTTVVIDEVHNSSAHRLCPCSRPCSYAKDTRSKAIAHECNWRSQVSAGTDPSLSTTCDEGSYA